MGKKQLNDIEKNELIESYLAGESIRVLSLKYNRAESSVRSLIKRRGIKLRPTSEVNRKYELNNFYFDDINVNHKAYFIGLLYADGCVKENRNEVSLMLNIDDKSIIEKLNSLIYKDKSVVNETCNRDNRKDLCGIKFYSKHVKESLISLGCVPNKTHKLVFPNWLNHDLMSHMIRGYFDGDGYIGIIPDSRKKIDGSNVNSESYKVSITGNDSFINGLEDYLRENYGIRCSSYTRNKQTPNIITIDVYRLRDLVKLYEVLYQDNDKFLIERKHQKFKTIINKINGKYDRVIR